MMTFLSKVKTLWRLAGGLNPTQVNTLCEFISTVEAIEPGEDWLGRPRTVVRFKPGIIPEASDFQARFNDLPGEEVGEDEKF